jgi:hypothetical protein
LKKEFCTRSQVNFLAYQSLIENSKKGLWIEDINCIFVQQNYSTEEQGRSSGSLEFAFFALLNMTKGLCISVGHFNGAGLRNSDFIG